MRIYVCHSGAFDYKKELYAPIRSSELDKIYDFVLPHELSDAAFDSRREIPKCDLIISEASFPSTPMGIELGWADREGKRILFIYKKGSKISRSLSAVSRDFIEYADPQDMITKLGNFLSKI